MRKRIICSIIFISIIILAGGSYYLWSRMFKEVTSREKNLPATNSSINLSSDEKKQLEEINIFRQSAGQKSPTEEEIKTQSEELNILRQQAGTSSNTKGTKDQADELDKLRTQSQ